MTAHAGLGTSTTFATLAARIAVALLIASAVTAVVAIARRLPLKVVAHARAFAWGALALTTGVVFASGGVSSVAVPALGLVVWALVATEGWRAGAAVTCASLLALAVRVALGHESVTALLTCAGTVAFVGFLPPLFGRQLSQVLGREPRLPRRIEARMRVDLAEATLGVPRHGRRDEPASGPHGDSTDQERLEQLLRDLRDVTGADEAILWELVEHRNRLVPSAWSTEEEPRPMFFRVQEWAPLVRWTAEERRVQLDGGGQLPEFAAAPVITSDDFLYGVLTLTSGVALGLSREAAREWLPRYGRQVANLLELAELRLEYSREISQKRKLLDAMNALQEHSRAEAVAPVLCRKVLDITSRGAHAALVRWLPDEHRGVVQYATDGAGVEAGAAVPEDSLVGGVCRSGLKLVIEDSRVASTAQSLYGGQGRPRPVPSLAVIPLRHDRRVIGAIVVEGAEAGAVTRSNGRHLELLASSVHGSLHVFWEIDDVYQSAQTDALTGLWNRRYFDEHIKKEAVRTNRSGSPTSLVIVDIDHFKQVNDTYGHEAGDAVLKQVAKVLSEGVRQMDICARYGGEEMAILLPQTSIAGAAELAERLRAAIAGREIRYRGTPIRVTASFGVASFPETVAQVDALFPAADKALYKAKSAGRNCIKVAPARETRSAP